MNILDVDGGINNLRWAVIPRVLDSSEPQFDSVLVSAVNSLADISEEFLPVSEVVFEDFLSDALPDGVVISIDLDGILRIDGDIFPGIPENPSDPGGENSGAVTTPTVTTSGVVPGSVNVNVSVDTDGISGSILRGTENLISSLGGFFEGLIRGISEIVRSIFTFLYDLLFPPPDLFSDAISKVKLIINSKFSFIDAISGERATLFELFSAASSAYANGGEAPSFTVCVPGKVFGGDDFSLEIFNFEMFAGVADLFRLLVAVFVYLRFILYFRRRVIRILSPEVAVAKE